MGGGRGQPQLLVKKVPLYFFSAIQSKKSIKKNIFKNLCLFMPQYPFNNENITKYSVQEHTTYLTWLISTLSVTSVCSHPRAGDYKWRHIDMQMSAENWMTTSSQCDAIYMYIQKVVVVPQSTPEGEGGCYDFVVRTTQNYHFFSRRP